MTYFPSTPNPATAAPAASGTLAAGTTFGTSTGTSDQRATPLQVAALLGAVPVPGTGTTPAATPFADVTGASWTIEQIAARVAAINGSGVAVPGQVTAVTIGTPTSSSLPLTWTAPSTGGAVAAYTVEERLTGGTTYTVCSTSVTTTSYVIPGLVAGTAYDVRVTATNGAGAGTPSAIVSATTAAAAGVIPGAVTALTAGTPTATGFPVTYTAPTTGTAPITYAGETQTPVTTGAWVANGGAFTATGGTYTGLAAATGYGWRIKATNGAGTSTTAASGSVTTAAAAAAPANTLKIVTNGAGYPGPLNTTPVTLGQNAGVAYGSASSSGQYVLLNTADNSIVNSSSTTVYAGWSFSSTTPPSVLGVADTTGAFCNGYRQATPYTSTDFNLGGSSGIGINQPSGFAPGPTGKSVYLWVSGDTRATWSICRDAGNVPLAFTVIG